MQPLSTTAPKFNPWLALAFGVLAVSTGAIFARLAHASPLVIAAYRLGIATLILALPAWFKAKDELLALTVRDLRLAALSGLFLALHFATWISSLSHTAVANSVVLVNTIPLWVGLLSVFVTGERISKATRIGILMSLAGGIIIGYGDFATGGEALLGDFLALAGGICAAVYLLLGGTLRKKLSLLAYVVVCYGSAAAILWAIVLFLRPPISGFETGTWGAFLGMALVSQCIGHSSYNWALRWFSTGLIALSLVGEPIISTILAYFLFEEGLSVFKALGGALILGAIYLAALGERQKTPAGEEAGGFRFDKKLQIDYPHPIPTPPIAEEKNGIRKSRFTD